MGMESVESLHLDSEQGILLSELLETERNKLSIEIRHTDHREYREGLRRRLDSVDRILAQLHVAAVSAP